MIVRDRTKRPVDVAGLAKLVTRPRSPQILPNIPRPILLSNQLRGLGCNCHSGLGIFDLDKFTQGVQATTSQTSVLGAVAMGANFVPGVGPVASSAISDFFERGQRV